MKICVAAGTRPEWIKLAPVIKELQRRKLNFYILNTGQHYSKNMSDVFFQQLKLPEAKYNLKVGSSTHGQQTSEIILGAERVFKQDKPDVVIVEGDTNSVLGVALAASKMGIKVAHVEAGLRSRDLTMPEEQNRIMVDHISSYLFAPTNEAAHNLFEENLSPSKISVTGNTIVDCINTVFFKRFPGEKNAKKKDRILVTLHRQENTDTKDKLGEFVKTLNLLAKVYRKWQILFLAHPGTLKKLKDTPLDCALSKSIRVISSCGYLEFLTLLNSSKVVLTDSGGVQEEACILGVPCVTLRVNTERPESIQVGANRLAGMDSTMITIMTSHALIQHKDWKQPFGDGKAAKRIVDFLERKLK